MPAFSRFARSVPAALFALSLIGFVPVAGFAQDAGSPDQPVTETPLAEDGVADVAADVGTSEAVAASDAPPVLTAQGVSPDGWQSYESFGLAFALPTDLTIEEQVNQSNRMEFFASNESDERETELGFGILVLTPDFIADLEAPIGTPGFLDYLEGLADIPVVRTDDVVTLDAVSLRAYRGTVPADASAQASNMRILFLLAETAQENGNHPLMAVYSVGLSEGEAVEAERHIVASLSVPQADRLGSVTHVPLIDGIVDASIAADIHVDGIDTEETHTWVYLSHPLQAYTPHTALIAGTPGTSAEDVTEAALEFFSAIDSVSEGLHGDAPVWVISGVAEYHPDGRRLREASHRGHVMVTQSCLPDEGPVMLGLITTLTRGAPPVLDAILSTMAVTMPADATPCAAEIGDAVMALPVGEIERVRVAEVPQNPVAEPEPALIEEAWRQHERFGLQLLAPDGMRVRRDRDDGDRQEYWLTNVDEDTEIGSELVLRIFTQAQRAELSTAAVDSAEFISMLESLNGIPMTRTGETVEIGNGVSHYFRGTEMQETDSGALERHVLFLINQAPTPTGLNPWVAIINTGFSEAEARSFEAAAISGLHVTDPTAFDGVATEAFLNGALRVAILPGQHVMQSDDDGDRGTLILSPGIVPGTEHTLIVSEARDDAELDVAERMTRRLVRIDAVTQTQIDGVPVWAFEGGADRRPNRERTPDGQTSPAVVIVTRDCLPGGGPIVIGVLASHTRLEQTGGFDAVLAPLRLAMPEGSTACPEALDAALGSVPVSGAEVQPVAPTSPIDQNPPEVPPIADGGKPGEAPMIDPDEEAWLAALAAESIAGMQNYLQSYPQGMHAQDARDWIAMHTPPAPSMSVIPPEPQAWDQAMSAGTPNALWTYIKAYPRGANVASAQNMLRRLSQPQPTPQPVQPLAPSKRG